MATPGITSPEITSFDTLLKGLWKENPVFVQVLGMCPVLAVTNTVVNSLVMGLATMFVLVSSSILVSAFRNVIPKQVRIATYILIIATFVTVAEYVIPAISLEVHRSLGAFVALIVVNCVILGRAEAFSSKNSIGRSVLDALGMGAGFTVALLDLGITSFLLNTLDRTSVYGHPRLHLSALRNARFHDGVFYGRQQRGNCQHPTHTILHSDQT